MLSKKDTQNVKKIRTYEQYIKDYLKWKQSKKANETK
jgi:hypothetical protein